MAAQTRRLLETVSRGKSGRTIIATPLLNPDLLLEFGVMRFFTATYGFIMRKVFELPSDGRTAPEDALAGSSDSKSLFVGRDDLADREPDPVRGALMLYSLTPPGAQLISYRGKIYRPHSAKLKAIHVTSARLVSPEIARLLPAGTTLAVDGGKSFVAPIQLLDALTSAALTAAHAPSTPSAAPPHALPLLHHHNHHHLPFNSPAAPPAPPPPPRSAWDFAMSRHADTSTPVTAELASTVPSRGASVTADDDNDEMLSPGKLASLNFSEWFAETERKTTAPPPPPALPPTAGEPVWFMQGTPSLPLSAAGAEPFWSSQGPAVAAAPQPRFPPRGPTVPPLFAATLPQASWGAAAPWDSTPSAAPTFYQHFPTSLGGGGPPPPPAVAPSAFTATHSATYMPPPTQPYLMAHTGHGGAPPGLLQHSSAIESHPFHNTPSSARSTWAADSSGGWPSEWLPSGASVVDDHLWAGLAATGPPVDRAATYQPYAAPAAPAPTVPPRWWETPR